jgi:hypothetical protein
VHISWYNSIKIGLKSRPSCLISFFPIDDSFGDGFCHPDRLLFASDFQGDVRGGARSRRDVIATHRPRTRGSLKSRQARGLSARALFFPQSWAQFVPTRFVQAAEFIIPWLRSLSKDRQGSQAPFPRRRPTWTVLKGRRSWLPRRIRTPSLVTTCILVGIE